MIFSTNLFILVFLPLFLAIYYLTPWRFKSLVILVASYAFYAWWRVEYLALIIGISLVSYVAGLVAYSDRSDGQRKTALWIGVLADLAALAYFKYATFFMINADFVARSLGGEGFDIIYILLPIGISFHCFQSISYVIDMYRRSVTPPKNVIDFLTFGAFFPQLLAGPVLRYKDLADQFLARGHTLEGFTKGVYRFIQGLAIKVLIADTIAPLADRIFASSDPTFLESWLGALAYTFQLFFDFAGYSAMAIGLAAMVGFRFVENFDNPYISRSITEFWRRWHISLSNWLRDYLYIPLGGNRKDPLRTYLNLWLTMVLGGFWHGANWTFLLWGAWHGGIMAVERRLGIKGAGTVYPRLIALPLTFIMVVIGWVMFRAFSVGEAFAMYGGMIGLNGFGIRPEIMWQMRPSELVLLALAIFISFMPLWTGFTLARLSPVAKAVVYTVLAALALSRIAAQSYAPFLYFQF